ncbi:hypothetical protein [Sphingobium fluviale]|uniref:hypothetical protein n=1 Tax=Sphingobium fluviale TaxID=2506423 RepID=UPI0013E946D8|nr:hypothetical protein [Sphingobium fluviale]
MAAAFIAGRQFFSALMHFLPHPLPYPHLWRKSAGFSAWPLASFCRLFAGLAAKPGR